MAPRRWPSIAAAFCTLILPLQAQTNGWRAVQELPPGTPISVVKHAREGCLIARVTDSELACDRQIGEVIRRLTYTREQVREVRLEDPGHNHMLAGALIGAAVGGLAGLLGGAQASDPELRGYSRAYGFPAGAVVGGIVGRRLHRHGPVLYRRP